MTSHDLSANGEPHAGSAVRGVVTMKPLKRFENLLAVTLIETNAVVLY